MTKATDGRKRARRAVGYIRVSDVGKRSGESFRSPKQQKTREQELAAERGDTIRRFIEELDVSGRKVDATAARFDRGPGWDEVERLVDAGEVDVVYVYDVKRFGRDAGAILATHARFRNAGVKLVIGDLPFDLDTRAGQQALGFGAIMAQADGDEKADRFELSKRDAWADGLYLSNKAPYGYRFVDERENRRLRIEKPEAAIVAELFELRAGGASWNELAVHFASRSGRIVSHQTMRDFIKRRAYLGISTYRGDERVPGGTFAPVVSEELWNAAQRPSARWKASTTRERFDSRAKSMLAGLARCGSCRGKMHRTEAGSAGNLFYRCSSRECTRRASIKASELDEHVRSLVLEWAGPSVLDAPEALAAAVTVVSEEHRMGLIQAIKHAKAELEAFVVAARGLTPAMLELGIRSREEDYELAVRELESFDEANVDVSERHIARTTLRETIDGGLSDAEWRDLLSVVLDAVTVNRGPIINRRARANTPAAERVTLAFCSAPQEVAMPLHKSTA